VACHRDDQPSPKATARQDSVANRAVAQRAKAGGFGAIPLDPPPLAAGSFILSFLLVLEGLPLYYVIKFVIIW